MLDGILGRGFSSKCKSLIKPTRTRIDVLRKRKEATQRFLKGNLAQLLSNGLDINAFGRTEEYLSGLDLLECYDFIEHSCEFISKHLSVMQKMRECPEDCREAVGSLMFAAARFSDLPELRDLRDALQERYGSSLEHFVNQKFVEKLSLREPPTNKKIQLLQNIASEYSIEWDARGFEQRMTNPSAFAQDQPKKYVLNPDNDHKYKSPSHKETDLRTEKKTSSKEKAEPTVDRHRVHGGGRDNFLKKDELNHDSAGREHLIVNNRKPDMRSEQSTQRSDKYGIPLPGRKQLADYKPETLFANEKEDNPLRRVRSSGGSSNGKSPEVNGHGVHHESATPFVNEKEDNPLRRVRSSGGSSSGKSPEVNGRGVHKESPNDIPMRAGWVPVSDGKPEDAARDRSTINNYTPPNTASSAKRVQEEESERTKPYTNGLPPPYTKSKDKLLPPPYIKSKDSRYGVDEEAKKFTSDQNEAPMDPRTHRGDNAVRREESDHSNYGEHGVRPARMNHNKDLSYGDEVLLPKPRPSPDPTRQKRESDKPIYDEEDSSFRGKIPLPKPRSIRRKHSKSSSSRDRDDFGSFEDGVVRKRSSSSRRRDSSRKGLQILFDDEHPPKDEEERVIDRLLMHYSKKPSNVDPEKLKRKSKPRVDAGEVPQSSRDAPADVQAESDVSHPSRSVSLPRGQIPPPEPVKVFTRANSFQPDNPARHVHPKLPDYDDLAARFAALRGR